MPADIDQKMAREGAHSLLSSIVDLNRVLNNQRKVRLRSPHVKLNASYLRGQISITVEFLKGSIKSTILELVRMYRPESLTIGTRGKQVSALEKMLGATPLGNLSKALIWQSPVPVIIVRPEDRIQKHLFKRLADPRRQNYLDFVKDNDVLPLSRPTKS